MERVKLNPDYVDPELDAELAECPWRGGGTSTEVSELVAWSTPAAGSSARSGIVAKKDWS